MSAVAQCCTINHTKIKHTRSVQRWLESLLHRLETFSFELETESASFLKGNTVC